MPSVAFDLRDYSTRLRIRPAGHGRGAVLVPRRAAGLPPLEERPHSSYRARDPRNFFPTTLNSVGDVVVPDVPAGSYTVEFRVPHYVARSLPNVPSPTPFPVLVLLHRAPGYRFAPEDTVVHGALDVRDGRDPAGFEIVMQDPEPGVPSHRVPVTAQGAFVAYVPEKRTPTTVVLRVDFGGASTGIQQPLPVTPHRDNRASPIVVT